MLKPIRLGVLNCSLHTRGTGNVRITNSVNMYVVTSAISGCTDILHGLCCFFLFQWKLIGTHWTMAAVWKAIYHKRRHTIKRTHTIIIRLVRRRMRRVSFSAPSRSVESNRDSHFRPVVWRCRSPDLGLPSERLRATLAVPTSWRDIEARVPTIQSLYPVIDYHARMPGDLWRSHTISLALYGFSARLLPCNVCRHGFRFSSGELFG